MKRSIFLLIIIISIVYGCNVTSPDTTGFRCSVTSSDVSKLVNDVIDKPTVSITMDDGVKTNEIYALPILKNYNLSATSYIVTDRIGRSPYYLNNDEICDLINEGWEVGAHTLDHDDMTKLPKDSVIINLEEPKQYLERTFGIEVQSYASPFGLFNNEVIDEIEPRYQTHLNAFSDNKGVNDVRELDPMNIHRLDVTDGVSIDEVCDTVSSINHEQWFVLIFHNIRPIPNGYWDNSTEKFERIVKCISESDVDVRNISEMYNLIQDQFPTQNNKLDNNYNNFNTLPDSISTKYKENQKLNLDINNNN